MAEEVEEEENSLDLFKFLVEGILMVTIGSMGLLGNLLCILIFSRCAPKLSQNSPKVVSKLCICCLEVVPVVSKLSRSSLEVVFKETKLSQSCPEVVSK